MNLIDLAKSIIEKSKKATGGQWEVYLNVRRISGKTYRTPTIGYQVNAAIPKRELKTFYPICRPPKQNHAAEEINWANNSDYIAACSPETISQLAEALIEAVDNARYIANGACCKASRECTCIRDISLSWLAKYGEKP